MKINYYYYLIVIYYYVIANCYYQNESNFGSSFMLVHPCLALLQACYMKIKTMGLANYLEAFGDIAGYFPLKGNSVFLASRILYSKSFKFKCF